MDNEFLQIRKSDLDEILEFQAKCLVGRVCKRFEILQNKDEIKAESKELIYEAFRQLKQLVSAYDAGLHITQFKFVKKGEVQPTK